MCGDGNFGQASWQANTGESLGIGQGIYSGAVNQKLFGGTLNSAGQPGCGTSCGVCYELMTTGVNAYNGGTPGGSTIQMMVVVRQIDPASRPVLYRADILSPLYNEPFKTHSTVSNPVALINSSTGCLLRQRRSAKLVLQQH